MKITHRIGRSERKRPRWQRDLVILGAVGNCLDILDAIDALNAAAGVLRYRCVGFLDDNPALHGTRVQGVEVLGPVACAAELPDHVLLVNGVGSPRNVRVRGAVYAKTGLPRDRFATIVHPSAVVAPSSRLGAGVVILANVSVGANAAIEDNVIVLQNSVISHDACVGESTCVAGGVVISGSVRIGPGCYLGAGCCIRDGITIGQGALVGMGSVVVKDVNDGEVVAGNPARVLRRETIG